MLLPRGPCASRARTKHVERRQSSWHPGNTSDTGLQHQREATLVLQHPARSHPSGGYRPRRRQQQSLPAVQPTACRWWAPGSSSLLPGANLLLLLAHGPGFVAQAFNERQAIEVLAAASLALGRVVVRQPLLAPAQVVAGLPAQRVPACGRSAQLCVAQCMHVPPSSARGGTDVGAAWSLLPRPH